MRTIRGADVASSAIIITVLARHIALKASYAAGTETARKRLSVCLGNVEQLCRKEPWVSITVTFQYQSVLRDAISGCRYIVV